MCGGGRRGCEGITEEASSDQHGAGLVNTYVSPVGTFLHLSLSPHLALLLHLREHTPSHVHF